MYNAFMSEDGMFQSPSLVAPDAKATPVVLREALLMGAIEMASRTFARLAKQTLHETLSEGIQIRLELMQDYRQSNPIWFTHQSITVDITAKDFPRQLHAFLLRLSNNLLDSVAHFREVILLDALGTTVANWKGSWYTFAVKQRYSGAHHD